MDLIVNTRGSKVNTRGSKANIRGSVNTCQQQSEVAHRTPQGSFALFKSVATATTKRLVRTEINPTL